jgi:uncharacterized tellurite resistance protein B-like protein
VDPAERRVVCELVAGVLLADDVLADAEQHFLKRVFVRCGLPEDEWGAVQPKPVGEASAALRDLPKDLQARVAALLVEAAVADGVIDPRERVYLLVVSAAMGIDAVAMEQRLAQRLEVLAERGPMSRP